LSEPPATRAPLEGDLDVDVAIIGGGYSGLWTARELLVRDPKLRVAIVEREICGFGASGRNGGWASALFPVSVSAQTAQWGADATRDLRVALQHAVSALGQAAQDEQIACDFHQGGSLQFARSEIQATRLRAEVGAARSRGELSADLRWMEAEEARARANLTDVYGAAFTPHCARVHPARLVRGLVDAVERRGARVYEATSATKIVPATATRRARALTAAGTITADVVVRATEGFTPKLGAPREIAPLYSLMVATEVQPASFWHDVGFRDYETFADDRHVVIYGQRTADDRIAFGGRGAPYHFGSSVEPRFDQVPRVFDKIEATVRELFPQLVGGFTHRWGGPLGMPRDHFPTVRLDKRRGVAVLGGYTGDGVVLSRVCATALAELVTNVGDEARTLPFVGRETKKWEYEPLRWLGINAGLQLASRADRTEQQGRTSRAAGVLDRLMGD
jgi:glycine/D-amino acid oxidase-like deaminating enzyme